MKITGLVCLAASVIALPVHESELGEALKGKRQDTSGLEAIGEEIITPASIALAYAGFVGYGIECEAENNCGDFRKREIEQAPVKSTIAKRQDPIEGIENLPQSAGSIAAFAYCLLPGVPEVVSCPDFRKRDAQYSSSEGIEEKRQDPLEGILSAGETAYFVVDCLNPVGGLLPGGCEFRKRDIPYSPLEAINEKRQDTSDASGEAVNDIETPFYVAGYALECLTNNGVEVVSEVCNFRKRASEIPESLSLLRESADLGSTIGTVEAVITEDKSALSVSSRLMSD